METLILPYIQQVLGPHGTQYQPGYRLCLEEGVETLGVGSWGCTHLDKWLATGSSKGYHSWSELKGSCWLLVYIH